MEIRNAEIEDLPVLSKIGRTFHEEAGFDKVNSYDEQGTQDSCLSIMNNPLGVFYVLWDEDKIAGFVSGGVYPNFYKPDEMVSHVGFICVLPEYRKKSSAKKMLMEAFETWALAKGAISVAYSSRDKQWKESMKRRGFIKTDVIYSKRLGE